MSALPSNGTHRNPLAILIDAIADVPDAIRNLLGRRPNVDSGTRPDNPDNPDNGDARDARDARDDRDGSVGSNNDGVRPVVLPVSGEHQASNSVQRFFEIFGEAPDLTGNWQ